VARIGASSDQAYKIHDLGASAAILLQILRGEHEICALLSKASTPMMIIGDEVLSRQDAASLMAVAHGICAKYGFVKEGFVKDSVVEDGWNGFNILHNNANSVAMLDIGFMPPPGGKDCKEIFKAANDGEIKLVYLFGADDFDPKDLEKAFVIYQGHHGDKGANCANLILPAAAYTEKDGIYINLEGRAQYARRAVRPPNHARSDSSILLSIIDRMDLTFPFNDFASVRARMAWQFPAIGQMDKIVRNDFKLLPLNDAALHDVLNNNDLQQKLQQDLQELKRNYYMTNIINKFSPTMLNCTKFILGQV
jgi:NADH-quinone oxidoreductase subunit G